MPKRVSTEESQVQLRQPMVSGGSGAQPMWLPLPRQQTQAGAHWSPGTQIQPCSRSRAQRP